MNKKIQVLLLAFGAALLLLGLAHMAAADETTYCTNVTLNCAASPGSVSVAKGGCVLFILGAGCPTVQVLGTGVGNPIGSFTLSTPGATRSIVFPASGTYAYTLTPGGAGTVVAGTYSEPAPALTSYGIGALILVLLGVTVWLFRRRRVEVA
jgi:hypothetical protein